MRPTSETVIGEYMARWIDSHRDLPLLLNQWAQRGALGDAAAAAPAHHRVPLAGGAHRARRRGRRDARDDVGARGLRRGGHASWPRCRWSRARRRRANASPAPSAPSPIEAHDAGRPRAAGRHLALHGHQLRERVRHQVPGRGRASCTLCHTTSWGMSTRMIGGVVMTHGDDKGLVLPPRLAPYQVVIVPIGRGERGRADRGRRPRTGRRRLQDGRACGCMSTTTRPQLSPGFKFNDWEMRGVPIRLELGPRDLEAGVVTLARRLPHRGGAGQGADPDRPGRRAAAGHPR